jgi:chromosome segregation ATPase
MARTFIDTDLLDPGDPDFDQDTTREQAAVDQLNRQKDQIKEKVADAAEEIERLQMRQRELEQERHALRELHRKQHDYEDGKKHLIEQLGRHIQQLQKLEVRLTSVLELVTSSRAEFEEMLKELHEIREDEWPDARFEESLDTALALIDSMRDTYNKSVARLDTQGVEHIAPRRHAQTEGDSVEPFSGGWGFCFRLAFTLAISFGAVGALMLVLYLNLK